MGDDETQFAILGGFVLVAMIVILIAYARQSRKAAAVNRQVEDIQ